VDRLHLFRSDPVLLVAGIREAGLEVGLHRAHLRPERPHVDDEVLDHRQVAHGGDDGHVARFRDLVHPRLARKYRGAVHAHATGAADHHAAALAVRERAVDPVLDDVEHIEQRRPVWRVDLVVA
jgi:hypothetical protein